MFMGYYSTGPKTLHEIESPGPQNGSLRGATSHNKYCTALHDGRSSLL